jgi:uncharacterized protein YbjT (DUF2867 family)
MYVVLGATGNTGSVAAKKLLESGEKVRVVGRDAARLAPLAQLGAEAVVADVYDSASVAKALSGATGAYLMLPPRAKEPDLLESGDRMSSAITEAVKATGLAHAVLLSSIGAQHEKKTGPIVALHRFEEKLRQVPNLNAIFLRPCIFMENFLMLIGLVQSMGFMAGGIKADMKMPMIATRDIGEVAAALLKERSFSGISTRELLGQRDLSHDEAASLIGAGIGKPKLSYQRFPGFMVEQALKQMGMPGKTAALMGELNEAANDGLLKPQEARSEQNTTPTWFETFVQEVFVPAYNAKAATA